LDGVRVLELASEVSASYCGKLLAELGADVVKVEPPGGDPLRAQAPVDPTGAEPIGAVFRYLNGSKRGLWGDLTTERAAEAVRRGICSFDILVEDLGPGRLESFGLGPASLRQLQPQLVVVRISPFGQTGPWSGRSASDLTLQAAAGMSLRLTEQGRAPASIGKKLVQYVGGTFAAAAALSGLAGAEAGVGLVADVSIYECLITSQSPIELQDEYLALHGLGLPEQQRVTPGFVSAGDGEICVSTLTGQNWLDLCSVIGHDEWADRQYEVIHDGPERNAFLEDLTAWTSISLAAHVVEVLQSLRIAAAIPADGRTILNLPPFVQRQLYVRYPGAGFRAPRAPYRLSETPVVLGAPAVAATELVPLEEALSEDVRPAASVPGPSIAPLAGLRVVDLSAFIAGAHVSAQLAALGADVIKVESPRRPDNYRFVMTYPEFGDQWWERSLLWQGQNLGKRSLSLDLGQAKGRDILASLIRSAHVLVENFTPRVIESFGFGWDEVRRLNPQLVMVRMPAFGLEGPWRDHVGFAYNIEQVGGLAQNGYDDGPLVQPAGIVDVINAQHALVATLAALRHCSKGGAGQLIEVSQAETVACLSAEDAITFQLTGGLPRRDGNRSTNVAPQGNYSTLDRRWVAITIRDDHEWKRLCALIGADDLAHLSLDDRYGRHDELDELLGAWTVSLPVEEVVTRLQRESIAAETLAALGDLRESPQLRARGFYRTVDHPVSGLVPCTRPAVLFDSYSWAVQRAPTLGEHSSEVLRQIGVGEDEIRRLHDGGVVTDGFIEPTTTENKE